MLELLDRGPLRDLHPLEASFAHQIFGPQSEPTDPLERSFLISFNRGPTTPNHEPQNPEEIRPSKWCDGTTITSP